MILIMGLLSDPLENGGKLDLASTLWIRSCHLGTPLEKETDTWPPGLGNKIK